MSEAPGTSFGTPEKTQSVQVAVDGLLAAYRKADSDLGEKSVHLPLYEVLEWKGTANIWNPTAAEFRQGVEARKEEPLQQAAFLLILESVMRKP